MAAHRSKILIIGAGVIGLTTALEMAEQGLTVRVLSDQPAQQTTSAAAGALWGPALVAEDPSIPWWSTESYVMFRKLSEDPKSGVRMLAGVCAGRTTLPTMPFWAETYLRPTVCDPTDLPATFPRGVRYTVPVIDMPVYLNYLTDRLRRFGVNVEPERVTSLAAIADQAPVIVNCTGLGARRLLRDSHMKPIRGHLAVLRHSEITGFFCEDSDEYGLSTYWIRHDDHIIVGGTAEPTAICEDPAPAEVEDLRERILNRAISLEPAFRDAEVLGYRTGVRPYRSRIRVEKVPFGNGHVIHNYGHGGAGVTLSWGCAQQAHRLAAEVLKS